MMDFNFWIAIIGMLITIICGIIGHLRNWNVLKISVILLLVVIIIIVCKNIIDEKQFKDIKKQTAHFIGGNNKNSGRIYHKTYYELMNYLDGLDYKEELCSKAIIDMQKKHKLETIELELYSINGSGPYISTAYYLTKNFWEESRGNRLTWTLIIFVPVIVIIIIIIFGIIFCSFTKCEKFLKKLPYLQEKK